MRVPQLLIGDVPDALPHGRVVMAGDPVGTQELRVKLPHLGRDPGRNVDPVRDGRDRDLLLRHARPDVAPHATGHLPMSAAHAVAEAAHLQAQHCHVESGVHRARRATQPEEVLAADLQQLAERGEVFLHQVEGKGIMAGRHRRVGREHGGGFHGLHSCVEWQPSLAALPQTLEGQERRMPFIGMPHGRLEAQRPQHAHAADAQDDLLKDTHLLVAAVQARGQFAIPGRVRFHISVHQVERHPADVDLPDRDMDGPTVQVDLDRQALAVREQGGTDRRIGGDERNRPGVLPAVGRNALVEVALRVEEPDADQGDAQVAGFLAVIAGQDAQAAAVDGQGMMQAEFRREIGDETLRHLRMLAREPRVRRGHVGIERQKDGLVAPQEDRVGGRGDGTFRAELVEQLDRIVRSQLPERAVEGFKEGSGVRVPAPPEIV